MRIITPSILKNKIQELTNEIASDKIKNLIAIIEGVESFYYAADVIKELNEVENIYIINDKKDIFTTEVYDKNVLYFVYTNKNRITSEYLNRIKAKQPSSLNLVALINIECELNSHYSAFSYSENINVIGYGKGNKDTKKSMKYLMRV